MRPAEVREFCALDETGQTLIETAMNQLQLSAWAYRRVLKLARTVADLAGSETLRSSHLAEAGDCSKIGKLSSLPEKVGAQHHIFTKFHGSIPINALKLAQSGREF